MENLDLKIGLSLNAGTNAVVSSLKNALGTLVSKIDEVTTKSDALAKSKVSKTINDFATSVQNAGNKSKKAAEDIKEGKEKLDLFTASSEKFGASTKLVSKAWDVFSAGIGKGQMEVKDAVKRTMEYEKAVKLLEGDLKKAVTRVREYGTSQAEQARKTKEVEKVTASLNKEISFSQIRELERAKALKVTANGFKFYSKEAYNALITDQKLADSVRQSHHNFTLLEKELQKASQYSKQYQNSLNELANTHQGTNAELQQRVKVLQKVDTALSATVQRNKDLTTSEKNQIASLDRLKVANAALEGSLKITNDQVKILSSQGLKALGNMTESTAKKLGLMDTSYIKVSNKLEQLQKLTGMNAQAMENVIKKNVDTAKSYNDAATQIDKYIKRVQEIQKRAEGADKLRTSFDALLTSQHRLASDAEKVIKAYQRQAFGYAHAKMALKEYTDVMKKDVAVASDKGVKKLDIFTETTRKFAKSGTLVAQAWNTFSSSIGQGQMTLQDAINRTNAYDKGLKKLEGDLKKAATIGKQYGTSQEEQARKAKDIEKAISSLNKEVAFSTMNHLEQNKALKVTSTGFQLYSKEAYNALITDQKLAKEVRVLQQNYTLLEKELQNSSNYSKQYQSAIKDLEKTHQGSTKELQQKIKALQTVDNVLAKTVKYNEDLTVSEKLQINSLDRWQVALAGLKGHLKITNNQVHVLSGQGLKALGNMTESTAKKLGLMGTSYNKLSTNLQKLQRMTGLSAEAMENIKKKNVDTAKSFSDASVKVEQFIKRVESVQGRTKGVDDLRKEFDALLTSQHRLAADANKIVLAYKNQAFGFNHAKMALQDYTRTMKKEEEILRRNTAGIKVLEAHYTNLLNKYSPLQSQAQKLISQFNRQTGDIKLLAAQLKALNVQYRDYIKNTSNAEAPTSKLDKMLKDLSRSMQAYSRYLVASQIIQGFTNSLRGASDAVVEHDQTLHELVAITGATVSETEALNEVMLQTASATKFTISEIGLAMKRLGQAGFNAAEVTAAIPNVADLATGSLESLENVVNLTTSTVKNFRLGMDQTQRVADVFANAVTNSRLTVAGLNTAMNYVGPIADQAGLSLEDTAAMMELLANAGLKFSTIGTGTRRLLQGLLKPSEDLKEAVAAAGLSMKDMNPDVVGLDRVLVNLGNVVKTTEDAFRMFGVRGGTIVSAIAAQGVDEFNRLKDGLDDSGAAARMAAEQMKGLQVILGMIKAKAQAFAVVLFNVLVPAVKFVLNIVKLLLDLLIKLGDNGFVKASLTATVFIVLLGTLIASLIVVQNILGKTVTRIQTFITAFVTAKKSSSSFAASLVPAKDELVSLTAATKASGKAMLAWMLTPIGAFITTMVVALTALTTAWMHYQNILRESILEQSKLQATLTSVEGKLNAYSREVKKSGQYSKDSQELLDQFKKVVEKTGEESELAKDSLKEFQGILSLLDEGAIDAETAINKMSESLKQVKSDSMRKASEDASRLYIELHRFDAIKGFFNNVINFGKAAKFALLEMMGATGVQKWMQSLHDRIFGGISAEETSGQIKKIGTAYEELVQDAEKSDKARLILEKYKEEAVDVTEKLLGQKDAASLTEKEILELATAHAENLKYMNPARLGAFVEAMKKYAERAKTAAEKQKELNAEANSMDAVSTRISKSITQMDKNMAKYTQGMAKYEGEYRTWQMGQLSKYLQEVEDTYKKEYNIINQAFEKEKSSFSGNLNEQLALKVAHEQSLKDLEQKRLSAKANILKATRNVLLRSQKQQIADVQAYYKNEQAIQEVNNAKYKSTLEQRFKSEIAALENSKKTELQILNDKNQLQINYYKNIQLLEESRLNTIKKIQEKELADQEVLAEAKVEAVKNSGSKTKDAEKTLSEQLHEIQKQRLTQSIANYKGREQSYKTLIENLKGIEKTLTDVIKAEEEKRKGYRATAEEKIRQLKYKTFTDAQKINAEERRLDQTLAKARREAEAVNYKESEKLYAQHMNDITSLANMYDKEKMGKSAYDAKMASLQEKIETDMSEQLAISQKQTEESKKKLDATQKEKEVAAASLKETQTLMKEQMTAYRELTGHSFEAIKGMNGEIAKITEQQISKPMEDLKKQTQATNKEMTSMEKNLVKMISKLKEAIKQQRILNTEQAKGETSETSSAKPPGRSMGGIVPGYGGGDQHDYRLERGEAITRKEVVKNWSKAWFRKLNKGEITPKNIQETVTHVVEKQSSTSNVEIPELQDFGIVDIAIGDKKFPAMSKVNVIQELQQYMRRSSLMGAN